jgi:hypothetical protein
MVVSGPPFYDPDEWEPDGTTVKEMLGFHGIHQWHGGILLSSWQLQLLAKVMQEEHGRHWKTPFQAFIDELTPVVDSFNKQIKAMAPLAEIMSPTPPKNGPQFNPHARRGKDGRR